MEKATIENQSILDVAMFVDWENMHGVIRGKANVSALREVAEGYGRLVVAKAYSDWREPRFQQDSFILYQIGFEPIYVPSGFKNNVDVKLASDCIDLAHRYPNIGIFILVTGDGDFIHVATALRPLGKKVIVIAQSNNASSRLGDLVDTLLIYEQDVDPRVVEPSTELPKSKPSKAPKKPENVYKNIVEIIKNTDGAPALLTNVKDRLIRDYGGFDQKDYGFSKFKAMIKQGEEQGYFAINTAGLRDWLTLPQEDTKTPKVELPNEIDKVFTVMVNLIKSSPDNRPLLSNIKHSLIKRYGGFDETVYGFNQFKQMIEEGERLGYFKLDIDKNKAAFVSMPKKKSGYLPPETNSGNKLDKAG